MKSEVVTESGDLLDGLPILRPETHGRHSKLDRLALKLRERFGTVEGFASRLELTPQELLTLHYEPGFSLRPVQQPPDLVDEALARWRVWFLLGGRGAGKTHAGAASVEWLDEIVAWEKDPEGVFEECCRVGRGTSQRMRQLGLSSRKVITTTPAPTQLFRTILKDREGLVLSRSSTFDNAANLDAAYIRQARRAAASTVGRREFLGELAFDLDPNLFRKVDWEAPRIPPKHRPKEFDFIVISVDPATGEKKNADMHGIVALGVRQESDGLDHVYVLADLSSRSPEPSKWARTAVDALRAWEPFAKKDGRGRPRAWIFAETNTGGSMVRHTIRGVARVTVKTERARQSKAERAAPVSMLAESGLVHMVGKHKQLEEQLPKFTGAEGGHARDDRVDAMCWPIFKYVVKRRKNKGAAERAASGTGPIDHNNDDDQ